MNAEYTSKIIFRLLKITKKIFLINFFLTNYTRDILRKFCAIQIFSNHNLNSSGFAKH